MAVTIPIISEFDGKGIKKGIAEFKQLEGAGAKASFALKRAALPAAAALGAIGLAAKSTIAAGEAAATANARIAQINQSMNLFGDATDKVNARLIEYANATARATGVDQNQIKATQAKLLTFGELAKSADVVGGSFDRATKAAIDLGAAGFGDAATLAVQLGKALQDPIKGITALGRSGVTFTEQEKDKIRVLVESNKMLEAQTIVLAAIEKQVGGTAEATANDSDKMRVAFSQLSESIGIILLPLFQKLSTAMVQFAGFAQRNSTLVIAITGSIAALASGILILNAALKVATAAQIAFNFAMAANPIGIVIVAIAGIVASFALLINKTGSVVNAFKYMGNSILMVFEAIVNSFNFMLNGIVAAINLIPGVNIPLIPKVVLPKFSWSTSSKSEAAVPPAAALGGTSGPDLLERTFGRTPTAPAPTVKLPSVGGGGGGGGARAGGGGLGGGGAAGTAVDALTGFAGIDFSGMDLSGLESSMRGNVNITINAAVAEATLADKIVDALTDYNRRSGPLDLQIAI